MMALRRAAELGITPGEAWLVLANWASQRLPGRERVQVANVLRPHVEELRAQTVQACSTYFDETLGHGSAVSWASSCDARLRRALARAG